MIQGVSSPGRRIPLFSAGSLCFAAGMLLMFTTSCGIGVRTRALLGGTLNVRILVAENANRNSPVAMDLVLVYDNRLAGRLLGMSARQWFDQREQIYRDYLRGESFDDWEWEWVPGQEVPVQKLPLKARAKAAFLFINYSTPGVHRFRIDPFKNVTVDLRQNDARVTEAR